MTTTRTALVTGATRGIGLAVAGHLAANGYDLTVSARNSPALDTVARDLAATHGVRVHAVPADLTDAATPTRLVEEHGAAYDHLSVLVLNAGAGAMAPMESTTRDQFSALVGINAGSALETVTAALPSLRRAVEADPQAGAKVIVLSSITGVYPQRRMSAYAASKAALSSLVQSINLEFSREGITGTAICPAYVATDMTSWLDDRIPADTMLGVDDVASVVSMLAGQSRRVVINEIVMSRAGTDGRIP